MASRMYSDRAHATAVVARRHLSLMVVRAGAHRKKTLRRQMRAPRDENGVPDGVPSSFTAPLPCLAGGGQWCAWS